MKFPKAIQKLIDQFSMLPSVGPKTAERYVLYLLKTDEKRLQDFAEAISGLKKDITICSGCYSVAENSPCEICSAKDRDSSIVCLVANTRDMISIENTRKYKGKYFVLGGLIDAIAGITPEKLNEKQLTAKIKKENVKEVIFAFNPTIEGETTALYFSKSLKKAFPELRITRLARGLPTGASLEYADEITLSNALAFRNEIN